MRDMLENADVVKMTEMTNSFDSIQELLKQIDVDYSLDPATMPVFKKLQKTHFAINEALEQHFL
jgi:hypothetical protein